MHAQLAAIVHELEAALARLHALKTTIPDEEWHRRRGGWSPAECIAHLNLTSAAFIPLLRKALDEARRLNQPAPSHYRRDPWGWFIWRMSAEAPRYKIRTTAPFVPSGDLPAARLIAEFERQQEEQIALTRDADGLPIHKPRIVSPFDARVKYSLYSALTIIPRHQHRHLRQAELAARGPSAEN